ncbi:DNA endonuclease RBBP8 isoform X2 [Hoplias malabaricus]|uniref:DNA endonuclease RBBP8 isoform X2 n=1 Tax=Hoplias malabaricus TaxID=27720 RepID=UPI003462B24D
MSSSQFSGTPAENEELFQDLLKRLGECHNNAMQGLRLKVDKLKKERCLDAQKLEEFFNRNQDLRKQQKTLQESVRVLNDRLQSGPCHHCRENGKLLKEKKADFENENNLSLISELKAERDILKEQNRKLILELEQIRAHGVQQSTLSEPEEGMIPDSPLQPMSFPVSRKLKRKRDHSHVQYAERPFSQPLPDIQKGEMLMLSNCSGLPVLVPETCDLDLMSVKRGNTMINGRNFVAETCRLDVNYEGTQNLKHVVTEHAQKEEDTNILPLTASKTNVSVSKAYNSPKQKNISPSSGSCQGNKEPSIGKNREWPVTSQKQTNLQELHEINSWEPQEDKSDNLSPYTSCESPLQSQNCSFDDQSWSLDPGAVLSQFDTESSHHPEPRVHPQILDMDCTYVSHSMLVMNQKQTGMNMKDRITDTKTCKIRQEANDSLANIFDTTAYGEYESCPQSEMSALEPDHINENEDEEDQNKKQDEEDNEIVEEGIIKGFCTPPTQAGDKATGVAERSFACVEVVRKKDERRKLQGHTCKECEIYYADLPVPERQKKLSSCSRHRFQYIPPSTPDNFWEVGFPSTQTCRERGYIKDEGMADQRLRRRRPYLATFSPKSKTSKT